MSKADNYERPTGISDTRDSPTVIFDSGKVRAGALSPAFPPTRSASTKAGDTSKVRIGALSPAFPTDRTR